MARSTNISCHYDSSSNATRPNLATPAARITDSLTLSSKQNKIPSHSPTISNMAKPPQEPNNAPITTTNIILDYLLYLSINARIEQARNDLKNSTKEQQMAASHRKKCQGVEAIVEGLLQSHRTQATSMILPAPLKHRLYLCQLLHLVYDRSKVISPPLKSTRILRSDPTSTARSNSQFIALTTNKQRDHKLPLKLAKYEKYFKSPLISRCRKHRLSICDVCNQHPIASPCLRKSTPQACKTVPGLIDAVPVFINSSAIAYRLAHEKLEFEQNDSILVKSTWYDLLLDLLTQAAIECYLCDSYSSIDALLEIFSYGDIDPSDYHSDNSESEDDEDPHFVANRADDYLLWQRTAVLDEFRMKKKNRMEEFLNVKGSLEQHFENLAMKYPVCNLETEMLSYCTNVTDIVDAPALIKLHRESANNEPPAELFHVSGRSGSGIDIPMSEDEFDGLAGRSLSHNSDSPNVGINAFQSTENNEKAQRDNFEIEDANTKKRHSSGGDQATPNKRRKNRY